MARAKHQDVLNGFARFPSADLRDEFLSTILNRRPELKAHAHLAETRPEIVFRGVGPEQLAAIREALAGRGKWFGDVQFQSMA